MKMWFLVLFSVVFSGTFAAPYVVVNTYVDSCRPIMKANGLSDRFPGVVAHGIHSITLEDIRYYFKPNATKKNNVPTLNYNLLDEMSVLPHAKRYGYDTSFQTIGMRHLDQVLKDMDRKNWYLTNYNTLERLVHTIHMSEVWAKAKIHYDSISLLKYNANLCACVKDVSKNGVHKMLEFMALKIKYPGITSGKALKITDGSAANTTLVYMNATVLYTFPIYTYHFFNKWSYVLDNFDFEDDIEEVKKKAATILVDGDEGMGHLKSENVWARWKAGMKKMVERDNYELAMFLYCTLRD